MAKSELIRSPSTGITRRTTIGKRWVVICQQDEASPCDMMTFSTREKAERCNDSIYRAFRPMVHYVEQAEVVTCDLPNIGSVIEAAYEKLHGGAA